MIVSSIISVFLDHLLLYSVIIINVFMQVFLKVTTKYTDTLTSFVLTINPEVHIIPLL